MPLLNVTEMHERLPFLGRPGAGPAQATSTTTTTAAPAALTTTLDFAGKVAEKASSTATAFSTSLASINMSDGSLSPHIAMSNTSSTTSNSTSSNTSGTSNNNTTLAVIITGAVLVILTATCLILALYALYKVWQQTLNLQYVTTQLKAMLLNHNLTTDPADGPNTYTFSSAEMEEGGVPPYDPSLDAKSLEQSEAWPVHPGTRLGTDLPSPKPKLKPAPFLQKAPEKVARGRGRTKFQGEDDGLFFSSSRNASPSDFGDSRSGTPWSGI